MVPNNALNGCDVVHQEDASRKSSLEDVERRHITVLICGHIRSAARHLFKVMRIVKPRGFGAALTKLVAMEQYSVRAAVGVDRPAYSAATRPDAAFSAAMNFLHSVRRRAADSGSGGFLPRRQGSRQRYVQGSRREGDGFAAHHLHAWPACNVPGRTADINLLLWF